MTEKKAIIMQQFEKSLDYILANITQQKAFTVSYKMKLWGDDGEEIIKSIKLELPHPQQF